jgi:ubiquinone/menaquinone biosynthesis C-methylase UbiE
MSGMGTDRKTHWDNVYRTRRPEELSWYQLEPERSLALIREAAPDRSSAIIDVGGGASTLVDELLQSGYSDVTVLDISAAALTLARQRLAELASRVHWIEADVLTAPLRDAALDVWHDRAVFHFLTEDKDRAAYVEEVRRTLRPGGHAVVATFADDGPTRCSGLPVARYSAESLQAQFRPHFQFVLSEREVHATPTGVKQSFVYCVFRLAP